MRGITRHTITVVLAVGGLLALGACGLETAATPSTAASAQTTTEPATATPSEVGTTAPVVTKRRVTVTRPIAYTTKRVNDSTLAKGITQVRARGRSGVKTLTYEVTLTDGVETDRKLIRQVVTRQPVAKLVAVGTKQTRQCDPNYSGACVPIASDVDCAGGSGNGPAYVDGPVQVVGTDIYDLDRDSDGTACDT